MRLRLFPRSLAGQLSVLLIAAVLKKEELRAFMALCGEAGLAALVEVHDEAEMQAVLTVLQSLA